MNKINIERYMDEAVKAIKSVFPEGEVDKSLRSKMSAFGAATRMSGKKSALAYYKKNEENVIKMLYRTYSDFNNNADPNKIYAVLAEKEEDDILERSVALKLALNLFIKEEKDSKTD